MYEVKCFDYPLQKEYFIQNSVILIDLFDILGAVVASRLSEITRSKVLLLEAGEDEGILSEIPILAPYLQLSKFDWSYKSEPLENACLGKFL